MGGGAPNTVSSYERSGSSSTCPARVASASRTHVTCTDGACRKRVVIAMAAESKIVNLIGRDVRNAREDFAWALIWVELGYRVPAGVWLNPRGREIS